jgi:hypothetical protein
MLSFIFESHKLLRNRKSSDWRNKINNSLILWIDIIDTVRESFDVL